MKKGIRRWIIVALVLCAVLVGAFAIISLIFPKGLNVPETFEISPGEITLQTGQGWQFQAVHQGRVIEGVRWTANGGNIGSEGFYQAPEEPGDYQIVAHHPTSSYFTAAAIHVVPRIGDNATETPTPETVTTTPTTAPTATPPAVTDVPPTTVPTHAPTAIGDLILSFDGSDDLVDLDTLEPREASLPGTDIRLTCFDQDRQLIQTFPQEDAGEIDDWDPTTDLILWITFYQPIPETLNEEHYWIFALDTDDDVNTGRPLGDGIINPDIGIEITIGVRSDPTTGVSFQPYMYVWNEASKTAEQQAVDFEVRVSASRDALFVRAPRPQLETALTNLSQVEANWEQAVGRSLSLATTEVGTSVDFFPERP